MADHTKLLRTALASKYTLVRSLGTGGMSTVYLAEDHRHRRSVAIKVLSPELATHLGTSRFLREVEILGRLTHPHIVPVHESGQADGLLYYVMPFVQGESLRDRLDGEKQLSLEEAFRIARDVADALDYAHRQGVVHRDIKPENILLEEGHAVVADFGIARAIDAAGGASLTSTGWILGTPLYMSPEQAAGAKDVDGRTDQYSLACVLYEMLAGAPPFTGPTPQAIQARHMIDSVPPLRTVRPGVSEHVERVLFRALAKTAADRFSTTSAFIAALETYVGPLPTESQPLGSWSGGTAGRPGHAGDAIPSRQRGRSITLAVAVSVVALVAVAAWQWLAPLTLRSQGSRAHHPLKKDWILVAEFDGPPDDSSLAVTTRDLVSAALDQSELVATVPRDQIRIALQTAGKSAKTRVDAQCARELAYRSAVRAVLEGKVGRLGRGYSVVLRVVDAESLKVVLTESATARNEDALIPTLGRLVVRLRAGLGEKRSAIRATRPMTAVATPSIEAYRLLIRGRQLQGSPDDAISLMSFRDALDLDRDFALAWAALGAVYSNRGQLDSALAAYDEALRRPQRLTTSQRLYIEGHRADLDGDQRGAIAAYARALQYDPTESRALTGSVGALSSLGRFEEALERVQLAFTAASPFGVSPSMAWTKASILENLGRVDEAREIATQYIHGPLGLLKRMEIEVRGNQWAVAESLALRLADDPAVDDAFRAGGLLGLASAQAARGAMRAAAATLERAEGYARSSQETVYDMARRARLTLTTVSGTIPIPADRWASDTSTATLVTRGLRAVIAGDRAQAQLLLSEARHRSKRELAWQGAAPALLQARIEALAGHWEQAARTLQPIASQRVELGEVSFPAGMSAVRWLLADVFEKLGRLDSAAVYLERATELRSEGG